MKTNYYESATYCGNCGQFHATDVSCAEHQDHAQRIDSIRRDIVARGLAEPESCESMWAAHVLVDREAESTRSDIIDAIAEYDKPLPYEVTDLIDRIANARPISDGQQHAICKAISVQNDGILPPAIRIENGPLPYPVNVHYAMEWTI